MHTERLRKKETGARATDERRKKNKMGVLSMGKNQIFRLPFLSITGKANDVLNTLDELRGIIAQNRKSSIEVEIDAAKIIFYEVI